MRQRKMNALKWLWYHFVFGAARFHFFFLHLFIRTNDYGNKKNEPRKWMKKKNRKMMMKIFFLKTLRLLHSLPFQYMVLTYLIFFYRMQCWNLISMEDTRPRSEQAWNELVFIHIKQMYQTTRGTLTTSTETCSYTQHTIMQVTTQPKLIKHCVIWKWKLEFIFEFSFLISFCCASILHQKR